ncbi:MAG: hypothetical protein ABSG40_08700 [Terriglobales bacterium]|jgi:hypothetical protein
MRAVIVALLAFCLLLGLPHVATAAGKTKIEIVEATTTVGTTLRTDPGSPEQIHTQCNSAGTDCNSTVIPATDPSSSLIPWVLSFEIKAIFPDGSHVELMCFPSPLSAPSEQPQAPPLGGGRAMQTIGAVMQIKNSRRPSERCGGIAPSAGSPAAIQDKEKLDSLEVSDSFKCFNDAAMAFIKNVLAADKTATCTTKNLGFYKAKWEYDKNIERITDHLKYNLRPGPDLVIYSRYGKVRYQVKGSW